MLELDLRGKSIQINRIKLNTQSFSRNWYISRNIKVCLVQKGEALWQIENRLVSVEAGDVVILNNHTKRVFRSISGEQGIVLIVAQFDPRLFLNPFGGLFYGGERSKEKLFSGESLPDREAFYRLFEEMEKEARAGLPFYEHIVTAKLTEVLSLLMRHLQSGEKNCFVMHKEMDTVLQYIDEHYRQDITLGETAECIRMSETAFSRYFSRFMGVGFASYVMNKRIQTAIYLLRSSRKTVLEIALECGFNSAASFYKAFKKITGLTPGDYRSADREKMTV